MYIVFYLLHEEPCNADVANKPLLLLLLLLLLNKRRNQALLEPRVFFLYLQKQN